MSITLYYFLLSLHLLGATLWTGGHFVLATTVLPRALPLMAWHITGVTVFSVLFVFAGASARLGGFPFFQP